MKYKAVTRSRAIVLRIGLGGLESAFSTARSGVIGHSGDLVYLTRLREVVAGQKLDEVQGGSGPEE